MPSRRIETSALFKNLDWITIVIYLLMVIAGALSIYAASYDFDGASIFNGDEFSGKQIRWIGLSLFIAFVIVLSDYRLFETYAYPIYIVIAILLFVTPFFAPDIKGSRSWLVFGSMSLQPAEFAKFATALALAKLFSQYNFSLNASAKNYLKALAIILIPVLLIYKQNETGSALTFLSLFFVLYREGMSGLILFSALFSVVVFVLGIKYADSELLNMQTGQFWILIILMAVILVMAVLYSNSSKKFVIARNISAWFASTTLILWIVVSFFGVAVPGCPVLIAIIIVAAVYLAYQAIKHKMKKLFVPVATAVLTIIFMFSLNIGFNILQPHQQMRINVLLGIEQDLRGAGYNVNQSKIAIGSGGLTGKGFLNGTQTKLKYVPEQHTDFIYCTIGEEEGFLGTITVMALFVLLILRIIKISERQPTRFGRVYGYCVASYLMFHFCINIGMVIGLCPVIGIPLPFFSYGGSSLWGFTILLFILLRIDASRRQVLTY